MRVRLKHMTLDNKVIHPIILPSKSYVSLIMRHFHECLSHQRKGISLNEIRTNGFWIIVGSSVVSKVISSCVKCQWSRGIVQQKMSY